MQIYFMSGNVMFDIGLINCYSYNLQIGWPLFASKEPKLLKNARKRKLVLSTIIPYI